MLFEKSFPPSLFSLNPSSHLLSTIGTSSFNTEEEPSLLPKTTSAIGKPSPKQLTLLPLIFLIYFEVAGGPYGEEPAVQAAGPLLAIIGFVAFPFIWSIPEALITAELSTAYPGNGGFVVWAERAFGPFFGSLMGSWKFLSGVINIAAFPALCFEYIEKAIPAFESGWPKRLGLFVFTSVLAAVNYSGLAIVGYAAVLLGVVSLSPFVVMSLIAIPKIQPKRWISWGQKGVKKDWHLYFNTLFWNLNFWDSVSTLAGEVNNPGRTFPLALLVAVIFTCVSYIIPLIAVIGAVSVDQREWESGFHATAAEMIGGKWLKYWLEVGAVLANIGLFEAQLSSSAYQLLGMAELGTIPMFFTVRSKWFGTPWLGILTSTVIAMGVSYLSFSDIVTAANFLYSLGMILEIAAFIWLRKKRPNLKRPYKIPIDNIPLLVVLSLIPCGFLVLILAFGTKTVYIMSACMTAASVALYFVIEFLKSKKVFHFSSGYREVSYDDM